MNAPKSAGIQYAALPYRIRGRKVEVLLITSRETRRWVIPKGWPIKGLSPSETAATEAEEEAGVAGEIGSEALGSYHYMKSMKDGEKVAVEVLVVPFLVASQSTAFKEAGQRDHRWVPYRRASTLVAEASLSRLIIEFGQSRSTQTLRSARAPLPKAPGDGDSS